MLTAATALETLCRTNQVAFWMNCLSLFLTELLPGGGARNSSGLSNMGSAFQRMHRGMGPAPERKPEGSKPSYMPAAPKPQAVNHIPSPDFAPSDTSGLQPGQKVEHQKFGFGEVIKMEGSAHNPVATVKFEHNGEKKIMLNYAKLRIVG